MPSKKNIVDEPGIGKTRKNKKGKHTDSILSA